MTYLVVSPKVGRPGDKYIPADGINVTALLKGGFIKLSATTPDKSGKPKGKKPADPTTEAQSDEE